MTDEVKKKEPEDVEVADAEGAQEEELEKDAPDADEAPEKEGEPVVDAEAEKAEKEKSEKEKAFLERRRKQFEKKEEVRTAAPIPQKDQEQDEDELAPLREAAAHLDFERRVKQDRAAFATMESEFVENIPDYKTVKDSAKEILKAQYKSSGMTDEEADRRIEVDILLKANKAYREGKDPVEEVYKEAQKINSFIDAIAQARGYVKPKGKVTNAQALREASKPNAMTGGMGRSSSAVNKTFEDLDDPADVADVPLRELMNRG